MTKILRILHHFIGYQLRFGAKGVLLFFQTKTKGTQTIHITPNGFKYPIFLRNDTSDIPTFEQVFLNQEYEFDYAKLAVKNIVDCGANIGLSAVFFNQKFPDANIIAIEPAQSNFEMMQKNTVGYPNIHCHKAGIWNRDAILEIVAEEVDHWGYKTREVSTENENTIKAIGIESLMKTHNMSQIDILKIDIEGSEYELFQQNTEKWLPKTNAIVIELHDNLKPNATKTFFNAIQPYNYKMFGKGENLLFVFDHK